MIPSTMQDFPLTIAAVLRHGRTVYADAECVTWTEDGPRRATYGTIADNAGRLGARARAARRQPGDRVGTFMWNSQEHMEAYLAIPSMGAVVHTLNIRLFPEQLAYVINHGEDKVVFVDDSLVPVLAKVVAGAHDRRVLRDRRRRRRVRCSAPTGPSCATPSCSRPSRPSSTGPRSTNARPRRCVTRRARPATRRASRTRTARRSCTRSRRPRRTRWACRSAIAS